MITNHDLLNPLNGDIVDRIFNELDLFYKCKDTYNSFLYSSHYDNKGDILDIREFIERTDNGIILNQMECIGDYHHRQIIEWIDLYKTNIKIVSSNGFDSKHNFHPLTNLALWESHTMGNSNIYDENNDNNIFIKPFNPWDNLTNSLTISDKNINYMLSVRRQTPVRDKIFKKLLNMNSNWTGVVRYSRYLEELYQANSDKTTEYIIQEKCNSYIDIVFETAYEDLLDDENSLSVNVTEKMCMAISAKTMPVVFGVRGIVKALEQMGFYIFNSEFNIDIDDYPHGSEDKINKFVDGILYINQLSTSEIKKFYESNYDKIIHNYNLLHNIFDINKSIKGMYEIKNYFKLISESNNITTFSDFCVNIEKHTKDTQFEVVKNLSDFNDFYLSQNESKICLLRKNNIKNLEILI